MRSDVSPICLWTVPSCQIERSSSVESPVVVAGGWMRTKPLIPEMCFTTTTEEDSECEEQPITPHLEEDGTSLLISCSQCSVRVHTSKCPVLLSLIAKYGVALNGFHFRNMFISHEKATVQHQHLFTDVCLFFCFFKSRLLRCGSCQCEQGVEMCTLQG